jgi:peptidoglycan/LPS O-acetylase OafA/YrhL
VEEHFYLLFPLLAWLLLRRPAMWKFIALTAGIVLGGIALRTGVWLHNHAIDPGFDQRNWYIEDIYYPTWCRLDGLVAGVSLAAWKVFRPATWERARQHANVFLLAGIVVMALALWLFRDRGSLIGNSVGWPVLSAGIALLVFAGAGRDSLIGRWAIPGAGWVAAISYSLYLVHKPMYHVIQSYWGDALAGTGLFAFCVYGATAIAGGALLHYTVERPVLKLRERMPFFRPRKVFAVA